MYFEYTLSLFCISKTISLLKKGFALVLVLNFLIDAAKSIHLHKNLICSIYADIFHVAWKMMYLQYFLKLFYCETLRVTGRVSFYAHEGFGCNVSRVQNIKLWSDKPIYYSRLAANWLVPTILGIIVGDVITFSKECEKQNSKCFC